MTDKPKFTVVFDFDGTVCLGNDPVRAYAEGVGSHLDQGEASAMNDELERFLKRPSDFPQYSDGYDVVQSHATGRLTSEQTQEAYMRSRRLLAKGVFDVRPPERLGWMLRRMGELGCRRVLASNSPIIGLREALDSFGVLDDFDEVIPGVGKPKGWDVLIDRFVDKRHSGVPGLLSIGDYWKNDMAPVVAAGQLTAFIHEPDPSMPATITSPTLSQMADVIVDLCAKAGTLLSASEA